MPITVQDSSPSAEALMRDVLRDGAPIANDYPLVFDGRFGGRIVTATEDENGESLVRATCALLVRELITPAARFRVGLIGSVVTDPKHRQQGWGRRVVEEAESAARAAGAVVAMLWADEPAFYDALGYKSIGSEFDFLVDPCISAILPSMQGVRRALPGDAAELLALYETHPERVDRSASEMAAMLSTPGMDVLVRESEGQVVAYACVGRGPDFPSVIHEWAGHADHVLALIQAHLQLRAEHGDRDPLVMMLPSAERNLRGFFDLVQAPHVRGVLGLGKLLNPEHAAQLITSANDALAVEVDPQGLLRLSAAERTLALEPTDAMRLLFGWKGGRATADHVEATLGVSLPALPLEPFIWGLDSI